MDMAMGNLPIHVSSYWAIVLGICYKKYGCNEKQRLGGTATTSTGSSEQTSITRSKPVSCGNFWNGSEEPNHMHG